MTLMFSLIILTGIRFLDKAFLLFSFCNSLNIFFLSKNLKENDRLFVPNHFFNFENAWVFFILLDCTENWISDIRVGCIILKVIVYVEIEYDFTKKCIERLS